MHHRPKLLIPALIMQNMPTMDAQLVIGVVEDSQ
jgi:hypothetical protein